RVAVALLQLQQQRQRVVVVDETHRLAGLQRVQRAEDRRVAEALADAAGVEGVEGEAGKIHVSVPMVDVEGNQRLPLYSSCSHSLRVSRACASARQSASLTIAVTPCASGRPSDAFHSLP